MVLKLEAVRMRDVEPITNRAKEDRWYTVGLQIGCNARWREYGGGHWIVESQSVANGEKRYKHVPALHKTAPLDGSTVNGLIEAHNRFLAANRAGHKAEGDIGRGILVLGFEETKAPEAQLAGLPFGLEVLLTKAAEAAATAAVAAVMTKTGAK
jgi:hypothetical protein